MIRGFNNDATACLLIPVEWSWDDEETRTGIKDGNPRFYIGPHHLPAFLFVHFKSNPDDREEGIFRSSILISVGLPELSKMLTILNLDAQKVLHFTLSDFDSWSNDLDGFDYRTFYNSIVDWFEAAPGPLSAQRNTELLQWLDESYYCLQALSLTTPSYTTLPDSLACSDYQHIWIIIYAPITPATLIYDATYFFRYTCSITPDTIIHDAT
ncbi:hypothetical protein POSPLADRAFT_1141729 [Postia placenta MAD-698-R-SB12]|uniref:Uncharacterized protein n=1 Tax=Postia placenta MAD-698-R-SB12 TaxID=670580 RepID=A0A1X6N206_9APHY|nr:hypothetical protein POSPLADRAFT_1141729 [Postia placenta MAD-698-R-SB12]OSX62624.1 hypothetical protein POSPLADRAFT_1141729 [Postia placenta MAD-698-R-SB12]